MAGKAVQREAAFDSVDFTQEDRRRVEGFCRALQQLRSSGAGEMALQGPSGEHLEVPEALVRLMMEAAEAVAHGAGRVRIVPDQEYVTTRQAAELLNVSRPHLVRLLDQESIPYRMVGSHRRIPLDGLLAYKRQKAERAEGAFEELFALNEEAGLYEKAKEQRAAGTPD